MAAKINKHCIGLTMNAVEWKAAEVAGSVGAPVVVQAARVDVPTGLMKDGLLVDVSAGAELLKQLLGRFSKAPIVVGAKNQNILMRMASFPHIPSDKIRGMISYQAQKFIPLPVAELVLDYVECGESMSETELMTNVLLVGAKKTYLNQLILLMNEAGRTLHDIDCALLATIRAIINTHPFPEDNFMLMDIDQEGIGVMICKAGQIRMARTVTMPEMLDAILQECIPMNSFPPEAIRDIAQIISGEFQASSSYYSNQSGELISRAYLRAFFPQGDLVAQESARVMGIPVTCPNPYPSMNRGADGLSFATCISLASSGNVEVRS